MELFFNKYSNEECEKNSKRKLFQFGIQQFGSLLDYLGIQFDSLQDTNALKCFELVSFSRGESILPVNNIGNGYLYYIIKGSAVTYINEEDSQTLINLKNEGNIIYDQGSTGIRFKNRKTVISRDSLYCLKIRLDLFKDLINRTNKRGFENFFLKLHQFEIDFQYKLLQLIRLPGEEMIMEIDAKFPGLFENFFAKDIAKLLGIKDETLSRLMRKRTDTDDQDIIFNIKTAV